MHNERELWIEEIIARKREGRERAADAPRHPRHHPGCPDTTDVMDVASEQAPPDVIARVQQHLATCDYCQACFAVYQKVWQGEEVSEPDAAGSMWEEMADGLDDLVVPMADDVGKHEKRRALEALALLVKYEPSRSSLYTATARYGSPPDVKDLRQRVGRSLFEILRGDLEIEVGPVSEAAVGTEMLRQLFDNPGTGSTEAGTASSFRELDRWLNQLRQRFRRSQVMGELELRPSDLALRQLAPQLLEELDGIWSYQLSFRLFLRSRLLAFCRAKGLQPRPTEQGGRFTDLDAAFEVLDRKRLGEVLRAAAADDNPELREWLKREELSATA